MSDIELVDEVQTLINETYYTFAAFALLAYEYAITFDREVLVVFPIYNAGRHDLSNIPNRDCTVVGYMVIVGNGGPPFIWAMFSTLRGYALSGRKWWIAVLIFAFYVPDIAVTCIYYSRLIPVAVEPPFNCLLASNLPEATWIHFTIAGRVCLIVGDLIVLIVTWHSTFGITRAAQVANIRMSLTGAILKDGTLYFACLLILNVVNIIVNAVPNNSAVSAFQDPITSILVSRFLLNLRDSLGGDVQDSRPSFVASTRHRHAASTGMQFANFVDPMGAELDHSLSGSDGSYSMQWSEETDELSAGNELASLETTVAASHSVRSPRTGDTPESVTDHSLIWLAEHNNTSQVPAAI